MKIKNLSLYPRTVADRDRLVEEYRMIGFHVEVQNDKIVIHSLQPKKVKEKKQERKPRRERD